MAARLGSIVPRFVLIPVLALLGTATVTFAAETQISAPSAPPQPDASEVSAVIVVPDVRRQAYVFAKGTLEDAGFGWQVVGNVKGYAANLVATQSPAPGTRVVDTGAPTVTLSLSANRSYSQNGTPENSSPYEATALNIAGAETEAAPAPQAAAKPAAPTPSAPKAKPSAPKAKPAKPAAKPKAPAQRPPAFVVAGAPKEPLDEMPLDARARKLARFVESHPNRTPAAVNHFVYQHAWIVTGAEFGWWHGEQALQQLIRVDRRAQQLWGVGVKSEALARAALARVQAKTR